MVVVAVVAAVVVVVVVPAAVDEAVLVPAVVEEDAVVPVVDVPVVVDPVVFVSTGGVAAWLFKSAEVNTANILAMKILNLLVILVMYFFYT